MKAVKIILGILIILSVIFLSTGLVIKENTYTTQVEINRPLAEVFKKFNDISLIKQWIPEIKSIDTITINPGVTGSKFKMIMITNNEEIAVEQKVLAFINNQKVTLFLDAESMLKTDQFTFSKKENKTLITLHASFKSEDSYMLSCFFPYFKGTIKKQDQQYLNNFKALVEK